MRINYFLSILMFLSFSFTDLTAQTAEEIIETYLETIGGVDALSGIKTMTMTANSKFQGMEMPIKLYHKAPNMQRMDLVFQGKEITQMCYDGETGWSTNFMTQEAELWDSEDSENMKHQMDFPEPFLNYADSGYSISLEGEENVDGTDCYKIKLTKNPIKVNGEKVENFTFYYFDKETYVPIMQEEFMHKGPMAGGKTEMYFSDYQEVEGVYHPHAMAQKVNGQPMFDMIVESIEINSEIENTLFAVPEDAVEAKPMEAIEGAGEQMEAGKIEEATKEKPVMKESGGDPGEGGK